MELRSQDKGIGMPSSLGYNPPNRDSSSKLSPVSIIPTVGERKRDESGGTVNTILNPPQTLDHDHLHHHHQFNLQQQQQRHIQGRDQNPDPDPVPAPIAVAGATTIPIASGSNSKSPLPAPAPAPAPPPAPTNSATTIRYRECLKNHAASMGGHTVDGCGEFMPSGEEGTSEALKCAACDCHRNFHLKEIDGESQYNANSHYTNYNPNKNSSRRNTIPPPPQFPPSFHPPQQHHHKYTHSQSTVPVQPMMMAFGNSVGVPADSSSEDLNVFHSNVGVQPSAHPSFPLSKKRFRTKFTQEQKDKMLEFAEKLGWRIQKQDEEEVQQFCSELGVKRQVFKVWMHNNKQAMKKKQL